MGREHSRSFVGGVYDKCGRYNSLFFVIRCIHFFLPDTNKQLTIRAQEGSGYCFGGEADAGMHEVVTIPGARDALMVVEDAVDVLTDPLRNNVRYRAGFKALNLFRVSCGLDEIPRPGAGGGGNYVQGKHVKQLRKGRAAYEKSWSGDKLLAPRQVIIVDFWVNASKINHEIVFSKGTYYFKPMDTTRQWGTIQ